MNDAFDPALRALARHFGLDGLPLDHQGATALSFDDGLRLTLRLRSEPRPRALAVIDLPRPPDRGFVEAAEAMLRLNGRLFDSQGASFALDPRSESVLVLMPFEQSQLEPELWPTFIEHLVATARTWREQLLRGEPPQGFEAAVEAALEHLEA
jgi:hypothetical protein